MILLELIWCWFSEFMKLFDHDGETTVRAPEVMSAKFPVLIKAKHYHTETENSQPVFFLLEKLHYNALIIKIFTY